jgi:hypothetical protein
MAVVQRSDGQRSDYAVGWTAVILMGYQTAIGRFGTGLTPDQQ